MKLSNLEFLTFDSQGMKKKNIIGWYNKKEAKVPSLFIPK